MVAVLHMNRRAVYKAISWEGISNAVCFAIAYCVFGNLGDCLGFTLACVVFKVAGYYTHERLWDR
jgi:uncharacterized membrane protein